jgi:hypothetical protein
MSINRKPYKIELSETAWAAHAVPLAGLHYLGVITRDGTAGGLARDEAGSYFAVTGRRVMPLITRKVLATLASQAPGTAKSAKLSGYI